MAYALIGDLVVGGAGALVEPAVNTVGCYLHERLWALATASRGGPRLRGPARVAA